MKIIKTILSLSAVLFFTVACSIEPINPLNSQNLSFDVVLDDNTGTKAESLDLYSDGGKVTFLSLEKVPETKSVQVNHTTTFTQIYDTFQVEGRENGVQAFYDNAVYNTSTGLWELQNAQYLWKPGKELEIVAAASSMDNAASDAFFSGVTYNGSPSTASFNYTLPDYQDDQQDFLVGYYKGVTNNGTVALKFNHPLTSLVFKVGPLPLGVTLQVNSITLEGIDASARCDISFGENTVYSWDAHSGVVNYTQVIDNPQPMTEDDYILDETASFIVIPRLFPTNSEARILLNITENGRTYDMYAPLAGEEWNSGETNIYQISYHGERRPVLLDGQSFNVALANLSGGSSNSSYNDGWGSIEYLRIPNVTKIVFETQSDNTEGITVNAPGERPIYMKKAGTVITVTTDSYEFYANESCENMFRGLVNLTAIEGLDNIVTSSVQSMRSMFALCLRLSSIDLHNFDTRNVQLMTHMFRDCEKLTTLDLSSFDTENVTSAASLFRGDKALNNIIWGDHFQLRNCTSFQQMFTYTPFTSLDLSFMIGAEGVSLNGMFAWCTKLESVNLENINDSKDIAYMFHRGDKIRDIILSSHVTFESLNNKTQALYYAASGLPSGEKCTITCTQAAKNELVSGTGYVASRFEWIIIPYEPYEP